jgi:formate dehydrogenase assembly factor FdhD
LLECDRLLMTHSVRRRAEFAVRAALGASSGRFSLAIAAVCAVLFGSASAMSAARENVGAENAIDKQVGHANGCVSISPWHN